MAPSGNKIKTKKLIIIQEEKTISPERMKFKKTNEFKTKKPGDVPP